MSTNSILATAPLVTTNFLLRATGTTIGNSLIWDNGTNVGIGTTSPSALLNVSGGPIRVQNDGAVLTIRPTTSTTQTYIGFSPTDASSNRSIIGMDNSSGTGLWVTGGSAYALGIGSVDALPVIFATSNNERMRITSAGLVGIGTTIPTSKVTITDTGVYGSSLNLSEGGLGAWVQGSTEGLTHAFIGNFKYNFTTPSSSFSYYSGTGYGIDMCDGIRFFSAQSNVTNGTFTPTERMRITSNGALMVATSTASNVKGIFIGGTNSSYINLYSNYSGGAAGMNITNSADVLKVEFYGSTGNYYFAGTNISDRRAKSNIQEITVGLSIISLLKPSTFTYDKNPDIVKGGFIAQEVQEVLPDFVTVPEDETEMMGVDYFGILALAVKAIQELSKQNEELSNRLIKLESK
jgi:hypothetical protein